MATKKPTSPRRQATPASEQKPTRMHRTIAAAVRPAQSIRRRVQGLLARRPHRSFQLTRRRDYVRSLAMPGYWSFSVSVLQAMWRQKRLFVWVVMIYSLFMIMFVGMGSQDTYSQLSDQLSESSSLILGGDASAIDQAGALLLTGVTGAFSAEPSPVQQVYGAILILLLWLTVVWLLRATMAGKAPRFRDGLYRAGAPIVPTALMALTVVVQLLPLAIALLAFSAAQAAGFLTGGIEAMIFWTFAGLLSVLSLYWLTSTFIALIVVTLPGMYPMQALRTAGDLVIGRRLRVLLRLLWLGLLLAVAWALVMIPIILFDAWLKSVTPAIAWLPVVPFMLVVMGALSVTIAATYVYILYRKMIDDDASPA